jgi:hypothetical protein
MRFQVLMAASMKITVLWNTAQCSLIKLNVVVKWLTLLLHIQEGLGSNLGLETDYPD